MAGIKRIGSGASVADIASSMNEDERTILRILSTEQPMKLAAMGQSHFWISDGYLKTKNGVRRLIRLGLVERPQPGIFQITGKGREVLLLLQF